MRVMQGQGQGLNVSDRAESLINTIVSTLNTIALKKVFKIPNVWHGEKWFNEEIRQAAEARDKAYRRAVYTKTEQDWSTYKSHRNMVVRLIKDNKKEYNELMIDQCKNDPATMWRTLKELITGETRENEIIEDLDFEIIEDNNNYFNVADKFNLFYVQSIDNIVQSIGDRMRTNKRTIFALELKDTMEEFEMTGMEHLLEIVNNLPNKRGQMKGYLVSY
ncbi:hypothetical protein KPH14_000971 [Odynerus spinipes]|uniref:Uncharacterized protein n=1 Tax=Odynerus spinipes TaxID=1348599 RepID=A0AAD9REX6_9HYME|nr:hypothetical protein KPH14_000971 [Odynerus spinipes]